MTKIEKELKLQQQLPLGVCPRCKQPGLRWFVGGIIREIAFDGKIKDGEVYKAMQACQSPGCGYTGNADPRWTKQRAEQMGWTPLDLMKIEQTEKEIK